MTAQLKFRDGFWHVPRSNGSSRMLTFTAAEKHRAVLREIELRKSSIRAG